ncbi:hypothetical protein D3C80_1264080 [compost metagenome]
MKNLNYRFLILEGEGRLEWAAAANPLRVDGSVDLHEQRVETHQQLRAKAQFLCLKSVSPQVAAHCAFWVSPLVNWPVLDFSRLVAQMSRVHWIVRA